MSPAANMILTAGSNWSKIIVVISVIWARSLAGKALRSQRRDRGFESLRVHQLKSR